MREQVVAQLPLDIVAVERKGDRSVVSEADRAVETLIRARLEESFPGDAILGERLFQPGSNEALDLAVGLAHEILMPLAVDPKAVGPLEIFQCQFPGLIRDLPIQRIIESQARQMACDTEASS